MSYMKELLCVMQERERYNEDFDYDPNDWPSDEEIAMANAEYERLTDEELASLDEYYSNYTEGPSDEEIIAQAEYYAKQDWYKTWMESWCDHV